MEAPTDTQINKFLNYLAKLEVFMWTHVGDREVELDIMSVVEWLKQQSNSPRIT